MQGNYQGYGYYSKETGNIIEHASTPYREVEQGEVWEGSKQDYCDTFNIEMYFVTKKDLINLLDQAFNCEDLGVLAQYNDTSINSIENWVEDTISENLTD